MATPRKRARDNNLIKCVLLDIEGTTTPISFVKDILFTYIRNNLEKYLENHWEEDQSQTDVQALREQAIEDVEQNQLMKDTKDDQSNNKLEDNIHEDSNKDKILPMILDANDNAELVRKSVVKYVLMLMDADRKVTSLKQLQGHMWRKAYSNGEVVGEIYKDVLPAINHWIADGKKVYIYSSGSVEAQKLLFGHTEEGDVLKYISGHFDTKIGAKVKKESYFAIGKAILCETKEILFLTDVPREARPAEEAGCQVAVVVRPGNATLSDAEMQEFTHVSSFLELYTTENNEVVVNKRAKSVVDGEGDKTA